MLLQVLHPWIKKELKIISYKAGLDGSIQVNHHIFHISIIWSGLKISPNQDEIFQQFFSLWQKTSWPSPRGREVTYNQSNEA